MFLARHLGAVLRSRATTYLSFAPDRLCVVCVGFWDASPKSRRGVVGADPGAFQPSPLTKT